MNYGFVYLLGNEAMPCHFKIGCTERAPHARARELSNASGVPRPFRVLLYIEVADFQRVERRFHSEMADYRASNSREFFCFGPAHMNWLWNAFENYEGVLAFTQCDWRYFAPTPQFPDDYEETWIYNGEALNLPDTPPIEPGDMRLVVAR
jgi:hypothetical protein